MLQVFQRSVLVAAQGRLLEGDLSIPEGASGIVVFVHGSGSNLYSSRHLRVAGVLNQKGIATLMLDLLTPQEELGESWGLNPRDDIDMLASRLLAARDWLLHDSETRYLSTGYFGSATGAVAALVAATRQPERSAAIVSRAGRLDLAMDVLPRVRAPTLLIVGGDEVDDLLLNQKALETLHGEKSLRIVPHATRNFEEPGALDDVAHLAAEWFDRYFRAATQMRTYGWADEQGRWV